MVDWINKEWGIKRSNGWWQRVVLLCENLVFYFEQSFHLVGYGVGGLPLQVAL